MKLLGNSGEADLLYHVALLHNNAEISALFMGACMPKPRAGFPRTVRRLNAAPRMRGLAAVTSVKLA
jgi:hypothetical protein